MPREKSQPARPFENDLMSTSHHPDEDQFKPKPEAGIFENKAQYLRNKRKTELEALENDLRKLKFKLKAVEDTMINDAEKMKEKNQKELDSVE